MPGKKPITPRPSLFKWHIYTPEVRREIMPTANALRRHPAISAIEKTLLREVRQKRISNECAGKCMNNIIMSTTGRMILSGYDVAISRALINKIPPKKIKKLVSGFIDRAFPRGGFSFVENLGKEHIEGAVEFGKGKLKVKILVSLKKGPK